MGDVSDEPQLTAPGAAPAAAPAPSTTAPPPPGALPPDDLMRPGGHGHALPASRPPDRFLSLRRWVVDEAAQLRTLRGDLREQLSASAPDLTGQGAPPTDTVVLVTSELATNALAHGRPPAQVRLGLDGTHVLVVVSDGDPSHAPFLAEGRAPGDGGFGLQIARRLSAEIGWWSDEAGKHVWATFVADAVG